MTTRSALVAAASASVLLLATTLSAQTPDASAASPGVSKVRIVRLSETKGQVQLDRNNGRGFEPGITNLPIVENSKLKTGEGVAEIEFEDNSSLRVAPDSVIEFPQLERMANGGTASTVHVVQGMVYVTLLKSNNNQFSVTFGDNNLALPSPSHVRLQLIGTEAHLAVLDGNLRLVASGATLDVPKKKTVTFDLLQHQQPSVAKDVAPEPYDDWDHNAAGYHSRAANSFNGSPYSYGANDLSYYGSFVGGCGGGGSQMWRPYFASAAWDPYANGAWAYYQGAGYSWVSPYPWGWMPYHSGSWSFCPGTGWGWMPGNNWNGLNNIAMVPSGGSGGGGGAVHRLPVAPPHPPRGNEPTMVGVNLKPLVRSELVSGEHFQFRNDSAGLGVPRGDFGKLNKVADHVQQHGAVNQQIYFSAPAQTLQGGHPTSTAVMAGSIHRGAAPPPSLDSGNVGGTSGRGNMGGYSGRSGGPSGPSMSGAPAPAPTHSAPPPSQAPSSMGTGRPR
jgi:FecR protein